MKNRKTIHVINWTPFIGLGLFLVAIFALVLWQGCSTVRVATEGQHQSVSVSVSPSQPVTVNVNPTTNVNNGN